MTPRVQQFVNRLRQMMGGSDDPNTCPVCQGHLDTDSGVCDDCGQDFNKAIPLE